MVKFLRYYKLYLLSLQSRLLQIVNRKKYQLKFSQIEPLFSGKSGLEIGGPSKLFSSEQLPLYKIAKQIDGCNFSNNTVWEGNIASNNYDYYPGKSGIQFISEGMVLSDIKNQEYDFLLSCHNLEHLANPIKALIEWLRVLKNGGTILLVLPDKRYTFDRKREITSFAHLISDFKSDVDDTDLTHLNEILTLHDMDFDPDANDNYDAFKTRCENNIKNRCLHHHVFDQPLLTELFRFLDVAIISQYNLPPNHQIIVGKKR